MTPNLGAIGFGEEPGKRMETRARYLAKLVLPYLEEGVKTARDGKVTYSPDGMDLAFLTLDYLAPLIDEGDFDESEKLLLHGIFSWIVRSKQAGMLAEKRLKIALALADIMVELYAKAGDLIGLDVDRSGE